ncbi:Myb-DNA-bind-2 domain-containing protein [Favolaschia claudopus]|uniref:Myb-DNA-bind-2 domain-containing protein n=1 Tax=Favolaschia claudopus TaxID=2862362 RepID=A0AAW0CCX2_9AGAR
MEQEALDNKLFVDENGDPLRFFLHKSIRQEGSRSSLESKIENNGGEISPTDIGSHVIIVNPNHPSGEIEAVRNAYKAHSDPSLKGVFVEATSWVNNSISMGKYFHRFYQKGMGGRVGVRERTSFTEEDDYQLARYLAILIPDKRDGGRLGDNVYLRLMQNYEVLPDEYEWATRHTAQSWRERYKKNQPRFDEEIERLAAILEPLDHQKYELSRKAARRYTRHGPHRELFSAEPEEEEEEEEEVEIVEAAEPTPKPTTRKRPVSTSGSHHANKRIRIEQSPEPQSYVPLKNTPVSSKGKEKALPEPNDDGYDSENSLFDGHPTSPPKPTEATLVEPSPLRGESPLRPPLAPTQPMELQGSPRRQQPARRISVGRPADRQPIPLAKRTARKIAAAPAPTPYRNTRSRSKSLEPYVVDVDALARKNRRNEKKKALEVVEEDEPDTASRGTAGATDTQEVADFLMAPNEQSGISDDGDMFEDVDRMPPPRSTARPTVRQPSMETDDFQTDQALRRRQVSFSPSRGRGGAREILSNLGAPRLSRPPESVTSKASVASPRITQTSPPIFFGGSRRSSSVVQTPVIDFQNPLYHPRSATSRKGSLSSGDTGSATFPLHGTRAKSVKREIKKQEKRTPYRPPSGTRALEHVLSPQ